MDDGILFRLPEGDAHDHEPDLMNDPAFEPPARRDTLSSKHGSEAVGGDTCRICRSEGTPDEPLFYPCKCSGSIKFVHQECLMEWLSHSHKKHCELCKTPFRFTKLYDANMPTTLPWSVFASRASLHAATSLVRLARTLLVIIVWMVILPFLVRWVWRWMFWLADAGWARQVYVLKMQALNRQQKVQTEQNGTASVSESLYASFKHFLTGSLVKVPESQTSTTFATLADRLSIALQNATSRSGHGENAFFWPQSDASLLSSWTYLSELTPNPRWNRWVLDVFEGQIITCVVITGFILLFLIREWVVQQQPLVNLVDNLNNQRDERDRIEQQRDRAMRQLELLEQARDRLQVLQHAVESEPTEPRNSNGDGPEVPQFLGWDALNLHIESASLHLRAALGDRNDKGYDMFAVAALETVRQFRAAQHAGVDIADLAAKVFEKLSTLSTEEQQAWEEVLLVELKSAGRESESAGVRSSHNPRVLRVGPDETADASPNHRPSMPNRDSSSRATQIQRLLEEADSAFALHDRHSMESSAAEAGPATETASNLSAPSTEGSWQNVTPADVFDGREHREVVNHIDVSVQDKEEIPITNAGPDAKINIRRSNKPNVRDVSKSRDAAKLLTEDQLKTLLQGTKPEEANTATSPGNAVNSTEQHGHDANEETSSEQPNQTDPQQQDTLRDRVADVFREEFGLDEVHADGDVPEQEREQNDNAPDLALQQAPVVPPGFVQQMSDWFWGDIVVQGAPDPAVAPDEEVAAPHNAPVEAQFAPGAEDHLAAEYVPAAQEPQQNDPEVVAAAHQAGLDAEAVEEAEDLEGIFELIGLQGPIIGLFQTSCFCCVLVGATIFGAVGMPYVWGKLVLSFLGDPWTFCVKVPLQLASFVADFIIDITLVVAGWFTVVMALVFEIFCQFSFVEVWAPFMTQYKVFDRVSAIAATTASSAGQRLLNVLASEHESRESLSWNWAFLTASVHAHSSLNTIKNDTDVLINYVGSSITDLADAVSSGSTSNLWQTLAEAGALVATIPERLSSLQHGLVLYAKPLQHALMSLKSGALTFQVSKVDLDPSLVFWNTADRSLAVLAGYIALVALATVYVAVDKSIIPYQSAQKWEKTARDTLRQAGGVFKVILIISIEMLVFPLYCGLLLDLAFLPLFHEASVATRWAFAMRAPYTFGFVHWFVGTCYMFHFALFVGMCRKILRKGVLWFIRDPDDPTFHPVRDVLERNVTTQLRKIAFSALVYGALVILCLGGVIWSIGKVFKGIFPIHWISTEPVLEFPLDLALYNFLTPLILRLWNPSTALNNIYSWWLRHCARWLRLSHFLFDDRRKDEEGRHVRKTWTSFVLMRKGNPEEPMASSDSRLNETDGLPDVYFKRDGKYVLTPCNDQYKPPKAGEAFLHAEGDDVYVADKDGKKNPHFAKVYVPPFFRARITMFMVCLWIFSAFTGLCATLLPLVFGRAIFLRVLPQDTRVNDIYSYSLGAYILGSAFLAALKGSSALHFVQDKLVRADLKARARDAMRYALQASKCVYVYGFTYLVIPSLFALILQLYIVLPMHTYAVATLRPALAASEQTAGNATTTASILQAVVPNTDQMPQLADHSIHILADYALCLLYLRIALRWTLQSPASRAAEAVRRITADGYLNPNVRLATRFFILPSLFVAATLLLLPPGLIKLATASTQTFHHQIVDEATQTLLYRYSYPVAAGAVLTALGSVGLAKATSRWRARIRDEVYLVGERLHNFGEKRPPSGSKSVVRRER